MKRVLFIDTGIECGGGTRSLIYLLRNLINNSNYNLSVFFEKDYEIDGRCVSQVINEIGAEFIKFEEKPQICKIKREILRAFSKENLSKNLYKNDFKFALKLLKNINVDVVYLNNHFSTNLACIEAANTLGIKVIQHLRKNAQVEKFKLQILRKLKFIPISVSNSTYEFYNEQLNMQKHVVYDPVIYKQNLKDKSQKETINLVMSANFLELKGHELVFDALLKLKRDDVILTLAGGGKFKESVQEKLNLLEKEGKVIRLGFVDNMDEIYSQNDYLLGFSSTEGMPRVVLEALSYGLGVIFSDISAIREIYEISSNKDNFHILKRDSIELLKCLEGLKKPTKKTPDEQIIKTFSMDNYIRSIDQILNKI